MSKENVKRVGVREGKVEDEAFSRFVDGVLGESLETGYVNLGVFVGVKKILGTNNLMLTSSTPGTHADAEIEIRACDFPFMAKFFNEVAKRDE